ncbi:MAG: DUF4113 domain-containing protein, partial [Alphaproteobacteria bacterium]|nr:DUF4113 domain-containing protein [Alphaproteobacteria bacterium]
IGRRLAPQLKNHHIHTALDLKKVDPSWMRRMYTVVGERLVRELNGIPCLALEDMADSKKSIQVSRSFKTTVNDQDILYQYFSQYVERLCEKLRRQNTYMNGIYIYMRSSPFKKPYVHESDQFQFFHATHDATFVLKEIVKPWLAKKFNPLVDYKKAGVMAFDLQDSPPKKTLFSAAQNPKLESLLRHVDGINQKYGKRTVHLFSSLQESALLPDTRMRSPAYTTRWSDLKVVQ